MSVIVSHPTGSQFSRAVLRGAQRAGILDTFWTSLALPPTFYDLASILENVQRELGRRTFLEVPWSKIRVRPRHEVLRVAAKRLRLLGLERQLSALTSIDAVYHHLDACVANYLRSNSSVSLSAVYAYEDGALESFRAASETGRKKIYDLPIAYWRTVHSVLAEEREASPEWAGTIEALGNSISNLARKDEEIETADLILVASSFTRKSIEAQYGGSRPTIVIPYGAPTPYIHSPAERAPDAPLRIVYAGHLDQRKGIGYLVASLERLRFPWHATLAGSLPVNPPARLAAFLSRDNVTYLGHVPHPTLLEAMIGGHVFVFPSLIEGFAMVLTEAMAAGLPIITTAHTAAPDIITEGVEGHIVPIRDPDAIATRLTLMYEDEAARRAMASAAIRNVAVRSWRTYEDGIVNALAEVGAV